jgi:hypothetical protein
MTTSDKDQTMFFVARTDIADDAGLQRVFGGFVDRGRADAMFGRVNGHLQGVFAVFEGKPVTAAPAAPAAKSAAPAPAFTVHTQPPKTASAPAPADKPAAHPKTPARAKTSKRGK